MKNHLTTLVLGVVLALSFLFNGCSGNPADLTSPSQTEEVDYRAETYQSGHVLWGVWNFQFNPATLEIAAISARQLAPHFDVTQMIEPPACNDCIKLKVTSFKPAQQMLGVDVTLKNPSGLNGYDVRGILYTDDLGHTLLNADAWTNLYEIPGGGPFNPFKAFAKGETKRKFAGMAEYTENYLIHFPLPPMFDQITYAVTASWPGNAKEPYDIFNFSQTELSSAEGSTAKLTVNVLDWQDDVNKVTLVAPDITGEDFTQFTNSFSSVWELMLVNNTGAAPGDYEVRIIATSANSGNQALYDFVTVTVSTAQGMVLTWGDDGDDDATDVKINDSGEIFVLGTYEGTVDFDPGPNVLNLSSNGAHDEYITKFDPDGNFIGVFGWGGVSDEYPGGLDIDSMGNVYIAGYYRGTVDFDSQGDIHSSNNGSLDAFLIKLDSGLNYQYTYTWGGTDTDTAFDVKTGTDDSVYIVGYFRNSVDFDPGSINNTKMSNGESDAYLTKFNSDGEHAWVAVWGGTSTEDALSLSVAGQSDTDIIYVSGSFQDEVNFGSGIFGDDTYVSIGSGDAYFVKYIESGVYQFGYTWGGDEYDTASSTAADDSGNLYVAGRFNGNVNFDPTGGTEMHASNGYTDVFLSAFSAYGVTFEYAKTWGGSDIEDSESISLDKMGNILFTGVFHDEVDFDPDAPQMNKSSNGFYDCFLSKFDPTGDFLWVGTWGGALNDYSGNIAATSGNSILVPGQFRNTVDFDPGPDETSKTTGDMGDAYLVEYLPTGEF